MNRRELLKNATILLGAAVSSSVSNAVIAGVGGSNSAIGKGKLSEQQMTDIAILSEMIVPTTDTPGAIAAGVPDFINIIFSQWFRRDEQVAFTEALVALTMESQMNYRSDFVDCSPKQQDILLKKAEQAAENAESALGHLYSSMRELTVLGFYTSHVGATQELQYNPVPLSYKGDYLFKDIGKQWSY